MTQYTRRKALKMAVTASAAVPLLAASAHAASHATVHAVAIKNFTFDPANVTINAGDSIVFTNQDGAPHTATDANGAFDTGRLDKGGSATLTFAGAGAFNYFCKFHPNMKGTITIA